MLATFKEEGLKVIFDVDKIEFYLAKDEYFKIVEKMNQGIELSVEEWKKLESVVPYIRKEHGQKLLPKKERINVIAKELNRLTLTVTNNCNMRCSYCYEDSPEGEKLNFEGACSMTYDIACGAIKDALNNYDEVKSIMFFGGEPTLEMPLIESICEFISQQSKKHDKKISLGMITNGTNWSSYIRDVIKKYNISTTVSIDGPKKIHDTNRIFQKGVGSFDLIAKNTKNMMAENVSLGIQATYTFSHLEEDCDIYSTANFLYDCFNVRDPHIVVAQFKEPKDHEKYSSKDLIYSYLDSYKKNLDSILNGDIEKVRANSMLVGFLNKIILKRPYDMICPAGMEIAVSPNGDYYPCFMFIDEQQKDYKLGSVVEGINKEYWDKLDSFILHNFKQNRSECTDCFAKSVCNGCIGANYNRWGDISKNEPEHCELIKKSLRFFILYFARLYKDKTKMERFKRNYADLLDKLNISSKATTSSVIL